MLKNSLQDLWYFGIANIKNCFFPAIIFGSLAFSRLIAVPAIPRYDLLLLICLFTQWWMIRKGIESLDELKVITVFHLMGLTMELFKVWKGSWAYPEDALTKFGGVPLYSGFMYASVASYLCQAWRRFNLQLLNAPRRFESLVIAVLIYLNFFTHHYFYDLRWLLAV